MIELRDVYKAFGERQILRGLTLEVPKGLNFVLMGPSGTGKSVTLRHIIGMLAPDRGQVLVDGLDVGAMASRELMELRKRMGYLFQNGALINWLTVHENVALPLREHTRLSAAEIDGQVMEMLSLVRMDHAKDQYPPSLSGGMKLRVGLARALITRPEYVLYDEPNAGLDPVISREIHHLIVDVRDQLQVTGLIVTHSRACATHCGDRIGILQNGQLAVVGSKDELLASNHPLVADFLGGDAD